MRHFAKTTPQTAPAAPNKTRAGRWSLRKPFRVGQRFYARRRRTRHSTKIRSLFWPRGRRKAPSRMEVNVRGALSPARGDLDDLVTSLMHDGTRWAAPRAARRAVVGLGVARRPAWFRHAAPIVTRGGHAFTEAGRVHGSWRAPRGDDSRPRHPVALEWDATPVDSVRRLVRPHAPIVIPALRLVRVPACLRRAPCSCPPVCVLICVI